MTGIKGWGIDFHPYMGPGKGVRRSAWRIRRYVGGKEYHYAYCRTQDDAIERIRTDTANILATETANDSL